MEILEKFFVWVDNFGGCGICRLLFCLSFGFVWGDCINGVFGCRIVIDWYLY